MHSANRKQYISALKCEKRSEELMTDRKAMLLSLDGEGHAVALAVYERGGEIRYWVTGRCINQEG